MIHYQDRLVHPSRAVESARPRVSGKFLFAGDEKLFVRGVTYGPFGPEGREFQTPTHVERDFHLMRLSGINAVRTYCVPPYWLLDAANRHGLRVLVGLAWEQHVAFLEDPGITARVEARVREDVGRIRGHPAILGYAVGNEIPAPIVRWHGPARVAGFLERLCGAVRELDRGGLVTYVNYPTTEYLADLPFLDFLSYNVYLECPEDFRSYLARLQNLAGDRPLFMAELGLDAQAHGEEEQARALDWQIRAAFEGGCAGAMVFSWTDQWFRGGEEIEGWSFGITTRARRPKPALHAVRRTFREVPFAAQRSQPFVSVVVCTYNGSATIREALEHLERLRYPGYEVIVVDDGSTDGAGDVAAEFDVRLIRTGNRGLSSARNVGLAAAEGEIVAYLDDDAFPDPDWLTYLVATFEESDHAGVGGPNLPPPDEGAVARCVARAPGGPIHVLLSDTEAEHIPGCNMAFRVEQLRAIGGFDTTFRVAGDDVDVCWRIQEEGWTLGFNPAAVVWHRRRSTVEGYWRQQKGYGRAEAMLERKWPMKYNPAGHVTWAGRLYDGSRWVHFGGSRQRIYQGIWGTAPFQSLEEKPPGALTTMGRLPEAWLMVVILGALGLLGIFWPPLFVALLLAFGLVAFLAGTAIQSASEACRGNEEEDPRARLRCVAMTAWLHLLHPLARFTGRISSGLAPWRRYVPGAVAWKLNRSLALWSEEWHPPEQWLRSIEDELREQGLVVRRGGEYDPWDLDIRSGTLGSVRALMAVEEHGQGRQLGRFRFRARWSPMTLLAGGACALLAAGAISSGAWPAGLVLGGLTLFVALRSLQEHAAAITLAEGVIRRLWSASPSPAPSIDALPTHGGPPDPSPNGGPHPRSNVRVRARTANSGGGV